VIGLRRGAGLPIIRRPLVGTVGLLSVASLAACGSSSTPSTASTPQSAALGPTGAAATGPTGPTARTPDRPGSSTKPSSSTKATSTKASSTKASSTKASRGATKSRGAAVTKTTPNAKAAPSTAKTTPTKSAPGPTHTVPIPASRAKVGTPRTWSGTGNKALGTITLKRSSVVHWTTAGGRFALTDASHKLKLSGTGPTGQSFAAAGIYTSVTVTAPGKWTLSIAPLGS
jgi:hypothetical protein